MPVRPAHSLVTIQTMISQLLLTEKIFEGLH